MARRITNSCLLLALLLLLVPLASVSAQSGDLTILFNADTRPAVPIMQFNPYPHEGIFATCSGLGAESSVYLQISVDGVMSSQQQCDVSIELHGLAGHSVDISAQDILGVGPVFHLLVYGTDPSATPTPTSTGPTATPTDYPLGCSPFGVSGRAPADGYSWSLEYSGRHTWPYSSTGPGDTVPIPPINADEVVIQLENVNTNNGGFSSYVLSDNSGVNALVWHLVPGNPEVNLLVSGVNQETRFYHFPTGGGDTSIYEADVCIWSVDFVGTPTPTLSPTSTATATAFVSPTPLSTPLPSYGSCVLINAVFNDTAYMINGTGDFFGRYWRIYSGNLPVQLTVTTPLGGSAGGIATRDWLALSEHSTFVRWSSVNPFVLQLCSIPAVPPTTTATINPVATLTPTLTPTPTRTATSTPTGTLTPSSTPTASNTPTVVPSTTPNATCLTPAGEDEAECIIIGLEQTQIALQQTMAAPVLTPLPLDITTSTPVFNEVAVSTVVAALCTKDPCYNLQKFRDTVTVSLDIFAQVDSSQCHQLAFPFDFGSGQFSIGPEMATTFGDTVCWFVELTTPIRNIMRFLSVIGVFFMLWQYYTRTMRRLGDV